MKEIPKLQTAFLPLIYNRELNIATSLPIDRTYNVRFPYNINVTKKRTHFASKSPRTSRRALNVLPYYINAGDLVTAAIGPLNLASPGQHYRAFKETNNIADHFRSVVRGNSGWTSELFAKEHPILSLGSNLVGDAISGAAIAKAPGALNTLIRMDLPRYGFTPTTNYYFKPGYLGMNGTPVGKTPKVPEGWEIVRPLVLNGKETWLVKHPKWGFSTLEEANGTLGRGQWAKEVTNEALDAYNPAIRQDPNNNEIINELRYIARKIDQGKETPANISNTEGYEYPKLMNLLLKTLLGQNEYPNGATMVFRGLWPGSSKVAKSPNYDALFIGYNRDMAMPYVRIGSSLGGKNNFGIPQYEKYFTGEKLQRLRELDRRILELTRSKGYYNLEDAIELLSLHNMRSTLLGDKMPEFGGLLQLLVPNSKSGEMLKITYPQGLPLEGSTFGDLGAGQPITIPNLAGDTFFYDANAVSGALASEGPARGYYGVFLHSKHPGFTGIHDKGIGSTLIWNLDGFAPFLKSVHGNYFKNLSGNIESAYKKGGKLKDKKYEK